MSECLDAVGKIASKYAELPYTVDVRDGVATFTVRYDTESCTKSCARIFCNDTDVCNCDIACAGDAIDMLRDILYDIMEFKTLCRNARIKLIAEI